MGNLQFNLLQAAQEVLPQVRDDQPPAPKFGPVGHQCPVAEVVLHLFIEEIAFADEKIRAVGNAPEGIGPLAVPGVGEDPPRTAYPVRVGGGAARVDSPDGENGQIPERRDVAFGQFGVLDGEFPIDSDRSGIEDLHRFLDALPQARGAGDAERGFPTADELGVEDEKGYAAEMVAVEVGDQDAIDRGGADPCAFHRNQRRGAAVEQQASLAGVDVDTRLEAPSASEVVTASEESETDLLSYARRGVTVIGRRFRWIVFSLGRGPSRRDPAPLEGGLMCHWYFSKAIVSCSSNTIPSASSNAR